MAMRLSTGNEEFKSQAAASSSWAKRPPHNIVMLISLETGIIGLGHVETGHRQAIQGADFQRQTKQSNEALGMTLIVNILLAKGCEIFAIQTERRLAACGDNVAFVKLQANHACHRTLRGVDKSINRFAQRREPQTVVDEFSVFDRDHFLEVHRLTVKDKRFKFTMGEEQNRSTRRFIDAMRLHANESILNEVDASDAMRAADSIESLDNFCG